jgi:hypothetical protein
MCRIKKVLFWFYRQHEKEVVSILEAINKPPASIVPTRKLLLLPYLLESKKLTCEEDYDKYINYLENAGYVIRSDNGAIALTKDGKKLLKKYQEFWLLRPMKIIQNSLKENLTAILAVFAVLISFISLFASHIS